jgi:flavodoxin/NAD-dependent dihydropyrimidine dehydrogenase PreA subunit
MKCIVIYFSQTGNTEEVARRIQAGVKQAAGHCDLVEIKEANPRRLYEYDLIGLGCPIMDFVEPGNVAAFINNMRFVGGKHAFAFSTHGTNPDYFFPSIAPKLKRRGLIVIGMNDWYAPCYLAIMAEPYPTAGHPDEIDLKEAEDFGSEMVERSRRISAGETDLIPPVPQSPGNKRVPDWFKNLPAATQYKTLVKYHKEKCLYPECRLCMDNCPMDGIDLSVEPPVLAKPCIDCTWCSQICPTGAMDGSAWIENISPQWRNLFEKYILPPLVGAEAKGRFRRLVPLEKIGYDTPVYKLHNKYPRWVIGKGFQ